MPIVSSPPNLDRRRQILAAAMSCFAQRGFHQTSMHHISSEAGISVGLIYRYFENKEAVISAMASEHKKQVKEVLERARQARSLLDAMEVLFTWDCCEGSPQVQSAFVVDLFAEASRNPRVAALFRDVVQMTTKGVTDLIARSPEARLATRHLSAAEIAELLFAVNDGMLMRGILKPQPRRKTGRRRQQMHLARNFWQVLFKGKPAPARA